MIKPGTIFASFLCSAAVLALFASNGVFPTQHPVYKEQYIVEKNALNVDDWNILSHRKDFFLCLTWVFATSGSTTVLPSDFVSSNQINCIGAGSAGGTGFEESFGCCGCVTAFGGTGGGGGAYAQILNYTNHTAGQTVNIQVGAGDTWFDTSTTVLASAAIESISCGQPAGGAGGQASTSVGTTKTSGGDGTGGAEGGTALGGTGGAAAGPTTFGGSQGAGASQATSGGTGHNYGGGGAGGTGVGMAAGGPGAQGLIAIGYGVVTFFTATGFIGIH